MYDFRIVGECRDSETMEAAIQAAISGHQLTTTVMQDSVEAGLVDKLVDELIGGYGLGLVLRPYEEPAPPRPAPVPLPLAAE